MSKISGSSVAATKNENAPEQENALLTPKPLAARRSELLVNQLSEIAGLDQARTEAIKLWHKWQRRRSRESKAMTWERMQQLLKETFVFPYIRVLHSIYNAKP